MLSLPSASAILNLYPVLVFLAPNSSGSGHTSVPDAGLRSIISVLLDGLLCKAHQNTGFGKPTCATWLASVAPSGPNCTTSCKAESDVIIQLVHSATLLLIPSRFLTWRKGFSTASPRFCIAAKLLPRSVLMKAGAGCRPGRTLIARCSIHAPLRPAREKELYIFK